jgi:hypothetical protein
VKKNHIYFHREIFFTKSILIRVFFFQGA